MVHEAHPVLHSAEALVILVFIFLWENALIQTAIWKFVKQNDTSFGIALQHLCSDTFIDGMLVPSKTIINHCYS